MLIDDIKTKYQPYLKPLLENKEIALCAWNPHASSLDEAVPQLDRVIKAKTDWRAVVINDRHILSDEVLNQSNPFDFVRTQKIPKSLSTREDVAAYRQYVEDSSQKAMENPLMKLSVWLNGYIVPLRPDVAAEELMRGEEPFSDAYVSTLREQQISAVDWESTYARAKRFDMVSERFLIEGELFNPPKTVIVISERAKDVELQQAAAAWLNYSEYDYSNFAEDNLYSSKMRCIVYQMPTIRGKIREIDYFKFLATILIFSENETSYDMFKPGRVYELTTELNREALTKDCNDYVWRLKDSLSKIAALRRRKSFADSQTLDDAVVARAFESDAEISVKLTEGYKKESLYCHYDDVGLSCDCPENEGVKWQTRYNEIRKHFVRFLRQPHRSIRHAVEHDFVKNRSINDERARKLTDFQKENIVFRLQEEEQNMVETATPRVFDKERYDEMLSGADREVKRTLAQRMTRKKTVVLGAILLGLAVAGFIPLLVSQFNNLATGSFGFLLTGSVMVILMTAMMICLFVLRRKLINQFKGFNDTIGAIHDEITASLQTFSDYLRHVCNVMREFSVLEILGRQNDVGVNIFKMHETQIEKCIRDLYRVFPEYIEEDYVPDQKPDSFGYDFEQPVSYPYDFTYIGANCRIPFLRSGTEITVPVNYILSIGLRREELYD